MTCFFKGQAQNNHVLKDTVQMRRDLNQGNKFSSVDNDSAELFADRVIEKAKALRNDYFMAQALFLKARIFYFRAEYKKATEYQEKTVKEAKLINDSLLLSRAYNLAGAVYFSLGNYDEALGQYNNRLNIVKLMKDTSAMLQALYNISLVYNSRSEYRSSIEILLKALDLASAIHDTMNLSGINEGLGMAYLQMADEKKAILYASEAYRYAILKKDVYEQGGILIDLGNIYQQRNDHLKAINYYEQAIALTKKNKDRRRQAVAISNKAKSLMSLREFKSALLLVDEAIAINTEIGFSKGIVEACENKSECLIALGDYKEAETYALRSADIAQKIGTRNEEFAAYRLLSLVYDGLHDNRKAYDFYKKFVHLRDSADSKDEIRKISNIEFAFEKEKLDKQRRFEEKVAQAEVEKQKSIRNIVLLSGIIMLLLFVFILRNYAAKLRANEEIARQSGIIAEQNESILESINYAKRIQQAILTPPSSITGLLPESFVLYRPKDIVSGDFYFIEPVFPRSSSEKWMAVALADCTGHGVPGALMSLTGYTILQQSLVEPEVNGPGDALDFLNQELGHFLKQNEKEQQIRDGMDVAFCAFNFEKRVMQFAGANNPLWFVSRRRSLEGQDGRSYAPQANVNGYFLYEIKADKQPIGYSENSRPFTTHNISLEKGDLIYLFTDGYADQFGGPKGKKFKYKQLQEILLQNTSQTMRQQRKALEEAIDAWRGDHEQVDDISLIGIRI